MPSPLSILITLLSLVVAVPAAAVELIVPRDRTVVREDTLLVLGTAPRGATVPWSSRSASGAQEDEAKADWGDLFEIFVLLDPGMNTIRVGDHKLQVFFATGATPPPEGFRPQKIHAEDVSRCEDCHDPVTMKPLAGGFPGVCLNCHVVVSANPENHRPAERDPHFRKAVARCDRCHDTHVGNDPKLLKASATQQCLACHEGKADGAETHPAFREGGCVACHDPHYSGYANALHEPPPGLCQRCHDQGRGKTGERAHPPTVQGAACVQCHDPHGTQPKLLRKNMGALCAACHTEVSRTGHGDKISVCSACHDPHQPKGAGATRTGVSGRCTGCHEGVGEGATVHPAMEEGCEACHDPHRDDDLDRARTNCGNCHELGKDPEWVSLHGDLTMPITACVSCHPPHASPGDKLVRGKLHYPVQQGQCSSCHGGGDDRSVEIDDVARRCRMCHPFERKITEAGGRLHDPVADGDCTACHDPHMGTRPHFLKGTQTQVCGECHDEVVPGSDEKQHPAAETCTDCHGAHGGSGPKFLSAEPPELCLDCHDDPVEGLEEPHPAVEEGCLACHDPHKGREPGYMGGDQWYAPCLECHEVPDLSDGRTLHSAAEACSDCHDPHGKGDEKYLSAEPPDLCFECHDDPSEGKKNPHPALEEGCLVCHDPHSGYGNENLVEPVKALCLECHDDPTEGMPRVHPPARDDCAGCHDPHGSDNDHLLRATGRDLCVTCHDFKGDRKTRFWHDPAGEDCANCHEEAPHAGEQPKFLSSMPPDLCFDCHDDPRDAPGDLHPALEEGCLTCHNPHAGVKPGFLDADRPMDKCLECHDGILTGKPVVHVAVLEGCSSCHDPHKSPNDHLLRRPGNQLCRTCHDVDRHPHPLEAIKGERFAGSAAFALDGDEYACTGCHNPHESSNRRLYVRPEGTLCVECHQI